MANPVYGTESAPMKVHYPAGWIQLRRLLAVAISADGLPRHWP
jgi:hypothetical protein